MNKKIPEDLKRKKRAVKRWFRLQTSVTEELASLLKNYPALVLNTGRNIVIKSYATIKDESPEEAKSRLEKSHNDCIRTNPNGEEVYEFSGMPFSIPLDKLILPKHNLLPS